MVQVKRGKFLSSASSGGSGKTLRASKDDRYYEDEADSQKRRGEQDDENSLDANYDNDEGGTDAMKGYDETKELFSDTEQDAVEDTGDCGADLLGGEGERERRAGSDDDGVVDDFSFTPTRDVGGYSSSSTTGKRANPFKVRLFVLLVPVHIPVI